MAFPQPETTLSCFSIFFLLLIFAFFLLFVQCLLRGCPSSSLFKVQVVFLITILQTSTPSHMLNFALPIMSYVFSLINVIMGCSRSRIRCLRQSRVRLLLYIVYLNYPMRFCTHITWSIVDSGYFRLVSPYIIWVNY